MITTYLKMKIALWLKLGAFDQIEQLLLRKRLYLAGPYCYYNAEQRALYSAYLDRLEAKVRNRMKDKI